MRDPSVYAVPMLLDRSKSCIEPQHSHHQVQLVCCQALFVPRYSLRGDHLLDDAELANDMAYTSVLLVTVSAYIFKERRLYHRLGIQEVKLIMRSASELTQRRI